MQSQEIIRAKAAMDHAESHLIIAESDRWEELTMPGIAMSQQDLIEMCNREALKAANEVAKKFNLSDYKVAMSVGKNAGQEVFHIHLHLLSVT